MAKQQEKILDHLTNFAVWELSVLPKPAAGSPLLQRAMTCLLSTDIETHFVEDIISALNANPDALKSCSEKVKTKIASNSEFSSCAFFSEFLEQLARSKDVFGAKISSQHPMPKCSVVLYQQWC